MCMVHYQLVICDYLMISVFETGYAAPLSFTWGQEVNQTVTCIPWEFCRLLQESSGQSPTVAMVLLYHVGIQKG